MRPSTASSESKKRSPWSRKGRRTAIVTAAMNSSCRRAGRPTRLAGRGDEGMEHADSELAWILTSAVRQDHRNECLVDCDLELGHIAGPERAGGDRNLLQDLVLWSELKLLEYLIAQAHAHQLLVG